ncbi:MAG TPA: hypothetical protein PLZ77_07230, partial [Lachnospiraceae bacterium]|nr:hypothetical protein [Lachnospiraceae bacterium]
METSVKVQDMFSYSLMPIYIVAGAMVLVLLIILLRILLKNRKKKTAKKNTPVVVTKPIAVRGNVSKADYLNKLEQLKLQYQQGECSVRDAYQRMSAIIRGFVEEATGIKVPNYTLQDIKELKMPVLEELIEEYYSPEFERE